VRLPATIITLTKHDQKGHDVTASGTRNRGSGVGAPDTTFNIEPGMVIREGLNGA
jgi:hypothetical protein